MQIGDLVFDSSLGQRGIIVDSQNWPFLFDEESEWEHTILYEDGVLDTAYERELEVVHENR